MTSKSVTRVELCEAVYRQAGLSRSKSSAMVELVLNEITASLEKGETVKLASFGSFIVREKKAALWSQPENRHSGDHFVASHNRFQIVGNLETAN